MATSTMKMEHDDSFADDDEEDVGAGIMIGWANDATLHACLVVDGAPISQGENPAASGVALRTWFSNLVIGVSPDSPVKLEGGELSTCFFHHLSIAEYGDIVQALLSPLIMKWGVSLNAAGLSAGTFYMVTCAGRGKNDARQQSFVPFL